MYCNHPLHTSLVRDPCTVIMYTLHTSLATEKETALYAKFVAVNQKNNTEEDCILLLGLSGIPECVPLWVYVNGEQRRAKVCRNSYKITRFIMRFMAFSIKNYPGLGARALYKRPRTCPIWVRTVPPKSPIFERQPASTETTDSLGHRKADEAQTETDDVPATLARHHQEMLRTGAM